MEKPRNSVRVSVVVVGQQDELPLTQEEELALARDLIRLARQGNVVSATEAGDEWKGLNANARNSSKKNLGAGLRKQGMPKSQSAVALPREQKDARGSSGSASRMPKSQSIGQLVRPSSASASALPQFGATAQAPSMRRPSTSKSSTGSASAASGLPRGSRASMSSVASRRQRKTLAPSAFEASDLNAIAEKIAAVAMAHARTVSSPLASPLAAGLDYCEQPYYRTALWEAAWRGHEAIVRTLLDKRAFVAPADFERRTPLHEAAHYGRFRVVELLLERGHPIDVADVFGQTPLFRAVQAGRQEVAQHLLTLRAEINRLDADDCTVHHVAAFYGKPRMADWLLHNGACRNRFDLEHSHLDQGHEVQRHRSRPTQVWSRLLDEGLLSGKMSNNTRSSFDVLAFT